MPSIGDKCFAAVQHIRAIGLFDGACFDTLKVRACRRFTHGNGAHHFTGSQLGQVLLLLGFSAVI